MNVLITGNLGYIGSHLTQLFSTCGNNVSGCDIGLYSEDYGIVTGEQEDLDGVQYIKNFRDLTIDELAKYDAIAHLAGLSSDSLGRIDPVLTNRVNNLDAVEFARKAKVAGVKRFAFASSVAVYGDTVDDVVNEESAVNPASEYAKSKLDAEVGLSALANQDFFVYLLRNASAFGSSKAFRADLLVNSLSSTAHVGESFEIKSDGSPWRPFLHCFDIARAFNLFLEYNPIELSGKPVNIGFDWQNTQVKDIRELLIQTYPGAKVEFAKNPLTDTGGSYRVDFSLLSQTFPSFRPAYPLSESIGEIKAFLDSINYSLQDHKGKRYDPLTKISPKIDLLF